MSEKKQGLNALLIVKETTRLAHLQNELDLLHKHIRAKKLYLTNHPCLSLEELDKEEESLNHLRHKTEQLATQTTQCMARIDMLISKEKQC